MRDLDTRYILDSTAFYAGLHFKGIEILTTPEVISEIKHLKRIYEILDILILNSTIKVLKPSDHYINKARDLAMKSNELDKLSATDISIIALALELNYEVITDDYAITNILKKNSMKVNNLIYKMRKVGKWIRYCKYCKTSYNNTNICQCCGNRLSRKLIADI